MAKNYSSVAREAVHGLSTTETPRWLLEITHPSLQPPVRVCSGLETIRHNGVDYIAAPISLNPPDDISTQKPTASLTIHSERALYWAERVGGNAHDARVRLIHVLPSDPDTTLIEYAGLRVHGMSGSAQGLSCRIGYGRDLRVRLTAIDHDAQLSPGLHL